MRLSAILGQILQLYFYIVIVRCFLTWIPNIDWEKPFFKFIAVITDTFLAPFRKIIPSFGGIDISPIVALLFLQICGSIICSALYRMGL